MQRGISNDEIRTAVFRGTLRNRRGSWVAEFRYLTIVFRLRPCNMFIITVHYRGLRR